MRLLLAAFTLAACARLQPRPALAPGAPPAELARARDVALDAELTRPGTERAALAVARIGKSADQDAVLAGLSAALSRGDCAAAGWLAFALEKVAVRGTVVVPSPSVGACEVPGLARAAALLKGPEALSEIAELVRSGSPAVAEAAALGLGVRAREPGQVDVVKAATAGALAEALTRKEDAVRAAAAYGLTKLGAPQTRTALLAALGDKFAPVRAGAARALGEIPGGAPGPLLARLADPDWRVRVEAARALASLAKRGDVSATQLAVAAASAIDASADGRGQSAHAAVALADAMTELPPAAALPHLERLVAAAHPNGTPGVAVACAFARARDIAAGAVKKTPGCGGAVDPPFRASLRVAEVLGKLAERGAAGLAPLFDALLGDADARVRAAAVGALAGAKSVDALPLLQRALADADPFVVGAAADALGERPDVEKAAAGPALVAALARFSAARALPAGRPEADALASILAAPLPPSAVSGVTALFPLRALQLDRAARAALAALKAPEPASPAPALERPDLPPLAARALVLHTTRGDVRVALASGPMEAPLASQNFAALAARHYFDGLAFHRVVPDFVVQGGDPRGDGSGGPGYDVPDELTPARFVRGAVGVALSGPDTGGSQLFVCHSDQPHLDGRYPLLGHVESGMDVVDELQIGDAIKSVDLVP